jgi:hypothetical protein
MPPSPCVPTSTAEASPRTPDPVLYLNNLHEIAKFAQALSQASWADVDATKCCNPSRLRWLRWLQSSYLMFMAVGSGRSFGNACGPSSRCPAVLTSAQGFVQLSDKERSVGLESEFQAGHSFVCLFFIDFMQPVRLWQLVILFTLFFIHPTQPIRLTSSPPSRASHLSEPPQNLI